MNLYSALEAIATVLGIAMVVCNIRVIHWGWPLAFASSALTFFVLWDQKIYANAALQVFFAAMALWGWLQWLRGRRGDDTPLRVDRLSTRGRAIAVAAWVLAWPALALFLARFTDSAAPWLDAFPTAGSVIGTVLLARKHLENWAAWIVVNLASIALFVQQQLWGFAALYALFAAMAVVGWRAWRAKLPA